MKYCVHSFLVVLLCITRHYECRSNAQYHITTYNQVPSRPSIDVKAFDSSVMGYEKNKNPNCFGFRPRFPGRSTSTSTTPAPAGK
ncbi:unnamed protein product [Acanthoscelides obtectus]|uniref:Secreted protein n=1 Tax=Acanthoscelides obtectus TaxID=200917 RepID=A0A9P0PEH9_ACAOB|nr:unnamed protein product [Acanthoscelides obtectus]CAK1645676.1 hypothetical protein AOBTE_LOCUS14203 [Acanthoscelides obtectus]